MPKRCTTHDRQRHDACESDRAPADPQAHVFGTFGANEKGLLDVGGNVRFYFDIRDHFPIQDELGREFAVASEAVVFAKYLAADLRCLETDVRPQLAVQVIGEDTGQIHEETVFS
jgi:hypothetical protein